MLSFVIAVLIAATLTMVNGHTVITYPGWRGDNLATNGTPPGMDPSARVVNQAAGEITYPWGVSCRG